MSRDPIIDEIHRVREEHLQRFAGDLEAVVRDIQRRQKTGGRVILPQPAKPQMTPPVAGDLSGNRPASSTSSTGSRN